MNPGKTICPHSLLMISGMCLARGTSTVAVFCWFLERHDLQVTRLCNIYTMSARLTMTPSHLDRCLNMEYFQHCCTTSQQERCSCKHEQLWATKTCFTLHTAVNHAEHMLLKDDKGERELISQESEKGMLRGELTFDRVPFSSTKRGELFFSGSGSDSLRHRQQKRLSRRPLRRGFLEVETSLAPGTEWDREET